MSADKPQPSLGDVIGDTTVVPFGNEERDRRRAELQEKLSKANVSRSAAKRVLNLTRAQINQATDSNRHAVERASQLQYEVGETQHKLRTSCAVIEHLIRRYGPQTFNVEDILETADDLHLVYDNQGATVTVRLRDDDDDDKELA